MKYILLLLLCSFNLFALETTIYRADMGGRNNCGSDVNADGFFGCVYGADATSACAVLGGLSSVQAVRPATDFPLSSVNGVNCIRNGGGYLSTLIVSFVINEQQCSSLDSSGYCVPPPQVTTCSDGYPSNARGYNDFCDRPPLKQCSDSSFVFFNPSDGNSICPDDSGTNTDPNQEPLSCTDYSTCYDFSFANSSCSSGSMFVFEYTSPSVFASSCSPIDTSSPDNPVNGGNGDGNPNNDPNSNNSSDSSLSLIDVEGLSSSITAGLTPLFSNVERSIRQGSNSINFSISGLGDSLSGDLSSLGNSLNTTNQLLSEVVSNTDASQKCIPSLDNNYCENPHGLTAEFTTGVFDSLTQFGDEALKETTDSIISNISVIDSDSYFPDEMSSSFLSDIYRYIFDFFPSPSTCQNLVFGSGEKFEFTITCEGSEKFKELFSWLLALYTVTQLIEILMTGIVPRKA